MGKIPISQKRAEKQRQENLALRRVLNVFLVGLVAECYLLLVNRGYVYGSVDTMVNWYNVLRIGIYVGLALLLLGGGAALWKRREQKMRTIALCVAAAGLFFAVSGWTMVAFFDKGVTLMCALVPIATLLGLVFLLFQHECFITTLVLAGAMFAAWVCGSALESEWRTAVIAGGVVSILLVAALTWLTIKAKKDDGKIFGVRVLSGECDYRILFAAYAVAAAAVLAALLLSAAWYYIMWILGTLIFAALAYYTTRLM